jgi:hypothetical protein
MRNRRSRSLKARLEELGDRCLLSGFSQAPATGFTPSELAGAYGLNSIKFTSSGGLTVTGDGSGETIALIEVDHDPSIQSDLARFDAKYHLPSPTLTVVNQAGDLTDRGWAIEESLDVEWAHAIAPGANLLVVEAPSAILPSQELQNSLRAVDTARNTAGVVAISMSWGFIETFGESAYDFHFTTPAGHAGITFIASSGDDGILEYPAASPNVLSVGGTSLSLTGAGAYGSETSWIDGGGGYSLFELEPSYQRSVQTTGSRSVPDVALDADPGTGVEVYATDPGSGRGGWQVAGGTSLGAPVWAGIIAIVDQGRSLAGKASLDGPTQTLPALYAAPSSSFNAVAPSSIAGRIGDRFDPFGGGGFAYTFSGFGFGITIGIPGLPNSGATANTATGLGSPVGTALVSDLVASTLTTPLSTSGNTGGQPGSGSANPPASPTPPAKPIHRGPKHHRKHTQVTHHSHRNTLAAHGRGLARQGRSYSNDR